MISYHCDSNTILLSPFSNSKYKHSIRAYTSMMRRLANIVHQVDVQILDNKVSVYFKRNKVEDWGAT